ncbi:hypothetical protein WJX72_011014 [[Myrmecia] bisecta]|uniref:Uncharacterized protein n=1 Tax=[Myrmecia] bisecta TaxID=41462 RepID=A0AAW1PHA7_9CHLO
MHFRLIRADAVRSFYPTATHHRPSSSKGVQIRSRYIRSSPGLELASTVMAYNSIALILLAVVSVVGAAPAPARAPAPVPALAPGPSRMAPGKAPVSAATANPDTCMGTAFSSADWAGCATAITEAVAVQERTTFSQVVTTCQSGFVPSTVNDLALCKLAITAGALRDAGGVDVLLQACAAGLSTFRSLNVACGCPIYTYILTPGPADDILLSAQLDGTLIVPKACLQLPISNLYYVPPATSASGNVDAATAGNLRQAAFGAAAAAYVNTFPV